MYGSGSATKPDNPVESENFTAQSIPEISLSFQTDETMKIMTVVTWLIAFWP